MSAQSRPITDVRFAEALDALATGSLYDTAASIKNSLDHLKSSNDQLQPYIRDGDEVCKQAVEENLEVITRMITRLSLLKQELESRDMPWLEELNSGVAASIASRGTTPETSNTRHDTGTEEHRNNGDHQDTGRDNSSVAANENGHDGVHL